MGGGINTPQPESMAQVLQSYSQYLPNLVSSTSATQPTIAENQFNATAATQPLYNALNLQQTQQYGVPLAQAGQEVTRSNALAGGQTQLAQMQNTGVQTGQMADAIARAANPNYYKVQDAASSQAQNLVNSVNLNGLSPGEGNALERSTNQQMQGQGNLGIYNPTNTINNAMNFGNAYNQKLGMLGSALGAANQTATSAQNTGFNPVNLAIGQPNSSTMGNFGTGTFSGTNAGTQNNSGSNAFGFGQGLMGNMSSMNNANVGAAASQANAQTAMMGQLGSAGIGAACCWIFMEAYKGVMPKFVRKSRDWYYVAKPDMATGYRRVAYWAVPAMRHSSLVRALVWHLMVSPITQYLGAVNRQEGYKRTMWNKAVTRFWLTSWTKLGKGHIEAEYLKPWMIKIA